MNQRYLCTATVGDAVEVHSFSDNSEKSAAPHFTQVACPDHGGNSDVIFAGRHSKNGVNRQRYECRPRNGDKTHEFTPSLPREKVVADTDWRDADVVVNPNRGKPASGRGHTADIATVVEGLRMLSSGRTYADVGRATEARRPPRKPREDPKVRAAREALEKATNTTIPQVVKKKTGADHWQVGADWCETYSPVLWEAWLAEIAANPPADVTPRVLVMDDIPFFGGKQTATRTHAKVIFSVLVAVEYFQPDAASPLLNNRVRLIRAFPTHTADAYELLVGELGYIPDVIVSDSSTSIEALLRRLRKKHPVVWIPSAFHVVKQLRKALAKMTSAKKGGLANAGDLLNRLESYRLLDSPDAWREWWDDFDAKTRTQQVAPGLLPVVWRRKYEQAVADALIYIDNHPGTPRGNGAVEATIRGAVKPFFEKRATTMGNIERTNMLCDLLCLAQNHRMDDPARIAELLTADLIDAGDGFAPPARAVADPEGTASLRDADILTEALTRMRKGQR